MANTMKWAMVGDLQIPYEDKRAVRLWFKCMKAWQPDAIDLLGDIDDQLEYSTFSDGTTDEFFNQMKKEPDASPIKIIGKHAKGAKKFYTKIRQEFPDANVHVSLGNHDVRIFKYIDKKAPEYNEDVTPNMLWGLDDLGFSWRHYNEKPFERFAKTYVHHGTTTSTSGPTVGKDIEALGVSLIRGHSHKALLAYKTFPMTGVTLHGLECGHMCDIESYGMLYADNPVWQKGFGLAYVHGGDIQLQFVPIANNYTCWIDGVLFKG